jgi:RPA family protein
MNAREVAWRVFAEEYNSSVLEHSGEGEKPVSYIITPLGAKVNRMLVVGVVTDIEDIGEEGKQRYRARMTDPTGTFYVSAGEYQPSAAVSLSKITPPAFMAVVGKSRAYTPEEGVKYLSIRPERIREVDADARDYWVLEAAKSTLLRIEAVEEGLNMPQPTIAGLMKLGYPENLADGVVRAIDFYKDIDTDRFRGSVREALRSILPETKDRIRAERAPAAPKKAKPAPEKEQHETKEEELHEVGVGTDEEDTVLKLMESLDSGPRGTPWDKIVEAAKTKKIDKVRLEEIIAKLLDKGEIYEPELGMMKKI